MPELLRLMLLSAVPTFIALCICIVAETVSAKEPIGLVRRFPGAFYILAVPLSVPLLLPPAWAAWEALGVKPLLNLAWLPIWASVPALILVRDFFGYWEHRIDHKIWWPIHSMHHSITDIHAANGYTHPFQTFTEFLGILLPLSLIDFGGVTVPAVAMLLITLQSMIIHSPLRVHFGPLRYVFVDSRFHRIHHSIEPAHFDKNFGTVITLWDQLFGTAYFPKEDEWPETGVEGVEPPRKLGAYLAHPFRMLGKASAQPALVPVED